MRETHDGITEILTAGRRTQVSSRSSGGTAGSAGGSAGASGGSAGASGGSAGASGGSAGSGGGAVGASGGSAGHISGAGGNAAPNGGIAAKQPGTGTPEGRGRRGCMPDTPDSRDLHYTPAVDVSTLPESADLRPNMPPVYAQGNLGSCSGNALAAAIEYEQMRAHQREFTPSRLFIYYNERTLEGTIHQDAGAMLRSGIKTVVRLGAPPETAWPYDEAMVFHEPHANAFAAAKLNLVTVYQRVLQSLPNLQACLVEGYPILVRINCYSGLDLQSTWDSGDIPMPAPNEKDDGGHALLIVGYDSKRRVFLVRNSWGPTWGQNGYGTLPFDYVLSPQITTDFWTIRAVTDKEAKPLYSPFENVDGQGTAGADANDGSTTPIFTPRRGAGGTAD